MKNKLIYFLCIVTLIYAFVPRVYAAERIFTEEDTSEYETEEEFVFSPEIIRTMAGTDSFIDKPATTANFDVPCKAAFLVEENSGRILYEKNCDDQVPMASITKIMTMLLLSLTHKHFFSEHKNVSVTVDAFTSKI